MLPHELSEAGDRVFDERGRPVASQRLVNGELAVLVRELPPFAGRRYTITKEPPLAEGQASAKDGVLDNQGLRVSVDPKTGGIVELRARGIDVNLADTTSGHAINDYLYLLGDDPAAAQKNGPVRISVRDCGPLVASLLVESEAPGCHRLARELRVTAGGDYVELLDTVDKKRLTAKSYYAPDGKESVHFAFPFHVPNGQIRLDVPFGLVRPEFDQMPSACKNWLTVGRWADVSNAGFGVTWVTLDAPLVEVGGITATLLNSQTNPDVWRKKVEANPKALLVGHEQSLGHELPRLSRRSGPLPVRGTAASRGYGRRHDAVCHVLRPAAGGRSRPGLDSACRFSAACRVCRRGGDSDEARG